MQPELEKISLEGVDILVIRNIKYDALMGFASAIHEQKEDVLILSLEGDESIETIDEEVMRNMGWCRCEETE